VTPDVRLDPLHEAAVDAACDLDRGYFAEHPSAGCYVRRPLDHEGCLPGERCSDLRGFVVTVTYHGPDVRSRRLVPAGARA
jgi:hypothetical protein